MHKHRKYSVLQWTVIIVMFLVVAINIEAAGRKAENQLPLPESSSDYGMMKSQRIQFDNSKLFEYAQVAINKSDYSTAKKHLLKALKGDPGSNRAKLGLIEVYSKQKNWDEAIELSSDLLKNYPDYIDGYKSRGTLAAHAGDVNLAISSYKSVVEKTKTKDERHNEALRSIAELYFKGEQYGSALAYGKELIKKHDSLNLRLFIAECAVKQKDDKEALIQFNAALPMADSDDARGKIQLARGFLLYKQKDFEDARVALEETLKLMPNAKERLDIVRQLGDIAYKQKKYKVAEKNFKIYLQKKFDEGVAAAYLETLIASEQWGKAQSEALLYIDKKGVSEEFRNRLLVGLVQVYKKQDNQAMAYKIAVRAYKATGNEELLLDMAYAAEKLDKNKEALQHYKTYLDKKFVAAPAFAYYYLLKNDGQLKEAETLLDRILTLDNLSLKMKNSLLYEKAQLYRVSGKLDEYYQIMDKLIARKGSNQYMMEYASVLFGAGQYDKAVALYRRCLDKNTDKNGSYKVCCNIADAYLAQGKPDKSRTWLKKALKYGEADVVWQLIMARVEYNDKNYEECVNILLTIDSKERSDFINIYIGFSFYKMNMPGLALYHLNKIKDVEALSTPAQRYTFYSNRAYLNYDQGQYSAAQKDVENALAIKKSTDMQVVELKTLVATAEYKKSRDLALEIMESKDTDLSKSNTGDLLNHIGVCELHIGDNKKAVKYFSDAIVAVPTLYSAYYLRGIAYQKMGKHKEAEKDYMFYKNSVKDVSRKFWGDLAIVEGQLKNYDQGLEALNKALEIYPYDIDTLEEAGYQYMKAVSNKSSQASFAAAIDIYNDITPLLDESNSVEYVVSNSEMKREYTKLDRRFGAGAYFAKTDYDLPSPVAVPAVGGALPSQVGVEVSYRPPLIGFRNERTFDLFVRTYGNFKDDSWSLDKDSYQVGFGVRYKPIRKLNAVISAEKLTKWGDNSEDNFLLRVLDSIEHGEKPSGDRKWQFAGRLYGDLGYFLQNHRRWYYYLDGREGVSWYVVGDKVLLTLPQVLGVVRHETDDESDYLSYNMVGVGASIRFLEPEHKRVLERGYIDCYLHYVWGEFWETPVDLDDNAFEGIVFGISFMK